MKATCGRCGYDISALPEEVEAWVDANLFGPREVHSVVEGVITVPLTPTQEAIKKIMIEVITKWESRDD